MRFIFAFYSIISFAMALYVIKLHVDIKRMMAKNKMVSCYLKDKSWLLMTETGDDNIKNIVMPKFSEEGRYIIYE